MKVEDICNPLIVAADRADTLREAARRMETNDVGSTAVFASGALVGILTERDLARATADGIDPDGATVEEYMTQEPVTAAPGMSAADAAALMIEIGVRHLPVARGDRLVGMVSIRDLVGEVLLELPPARRTA